MWGPAWAGPALLAGVALLVACSGDGGPLPSAPGGSGPAPGEAVSSTVPPPTPTPAPAPPPAAHCYGPRTRELQVALRQHGVSASRVDGPGARFEMLPAGKGSVFRKCQVISYYGHPESPLMGVLGTGTPEDVVQRLLTQAAAYDMMNGERGVAPALHLIWATAQGAPTPDGTYLYRMPDEMVREYLDAAERHDLLVFLDIQMGSSSVDAEWPRVEAYLRDPRVHLALDPEFVAPPGLPPGVVIGSLDVAEINRAQERLQRLVEEEGLPNKILVVHQFMSEMILGKAAISDVPNVDVVIDMDGFGSSYAKLTKYDLFIGADGAEHGGIKLFYDHDFDLLTPAQVTSLAPQPDVVIYQ